MNENKVDTFFKIKRELNDDSIYTTEDLELMASGQFIDKTVPVNQDHENAIKKKIRIADAEEDYDYSREKLKSLIEKGELAMESLIEIAGASQKARDFEVVGHLIKTIGETLDRVQNLHKTENSAQSKERAEVNVDRAIFVGSPTELLRKLKNGE